MSGNQLDAAQLDRVYSSNHSTWFDHVITLDHDGQQTLSDHIPVTVTIALTPPPPSTGLRKSSYFKFDHTYLNLADCLNAARALPAANPNARKTLAIFIMMLFVEWNES
jgi:hypothetical protein